MNNKIKSVIKLFLAVLVLTAFLQIVLPATNTDEFVSFVSKIGYWGPLIVIAYTVLSHVVAPLAGTPAVVLGFSIYGVYKGTLYLYIASLISATINFYIARTYGRDWIEKLIGKKSLTETDAIVEVAGTKVLILARIFGFSLFELVSYAAGLTPMRFLRYIAITALFSLIPNVIFVIFFQSIDFASRAGIILWLGSLLIAGAVFTYFFKRLVKVPK